MRVTKSVISLVLAGYATQQSPEGAAVRIVSDSINCGFIGSANGRFWPKAALRFSENPSI